MSFIPLVGQLLSVGIDLLNASISLARGNYQDAGLYAFSAIPVVGDAAAVGRLGLGLKKAYQASIAVKRDHTAFRVIDTGINLYFVGQIATALADAYVIDPIVDWLAESPSNSFVAGTGVVTGEDEDGNLITTNIEDLEIGDLILARDEFDPNAPNRYSIVTAVSHRTVYEQTTVTYIDESGNTEVIESTGNHEYYIDGLGWVTAELLTAGQEVVLPDGRTATITSVVSTEIPEGVEVYNLTVADAATYFVDDGVGGGSAVWVHNTSFIKQALNLIKKSDVKKLLVISKSGRRELIRVSLLHGDHVLPQQAVLNALKKARVAEGSKKYNQVIDALNGKTGNGNLIPFLGSLNSSKGDLNAAKFALTPLGSKLRKVTIDKIDRTQRRVAAGINEIINKDRSKQKDWFDEIGFF